MKVPVYGQPQVAPAALPNVRSNLDVRNGLDAVGAGLQRAGEGVFQELRVEHEKGLAAAATDAENQLASFALDVEHGTPDGSQKGLFQARGQEALAGSAPAIEALEKKAEELAGGLAPGAKEMFTARSKAMLLEHRRSIETWAANQGEALNRATALARADTAARTAALNYADDALVAKEYEAARTSLAAQLHGMGPEVLGAQLSALSQRMSEARIRGAVQAGDAETAQSLLAAHHQDLGEQAPQMEHLVKVLVDARQSDTKTQEITSAATVKGYPWLDASAALAKVEELPAGPLKDATRQRVEHQLELNRRMKDEAGRERLNQLQAFYAQSGDPNDPRMAPVRAWMMDPHNGAADLLLKFDKSLEAEKRASHVATSAERRAQAQADRNAYLDFMARPLDERTKVDVEREYLGDTSKAGRDRIRGQQQKDLAVIRKGGIEGDEEFGRDVRAQALQAKLDDGTDLSKQPKLRGFIGHMNAWRQQYLLDHQKPPTRKDVREEMAHALTKVVKPGFLWNDTVFRFEAANGDSLKIAPQDEQTYPIAPGTETAPIPVSPGQSAAGLNLDAPPTPAAAKVSPGDQAALNWLKANPTHPKAKQVEAALRAKGLL